MQQERDPHLWQIAQKRASFRYHAMSYLVVILFLWAIWYFSGSDGYSKYPWPIWPTLGWGIGLIFHYLGAFVFTKYDSVQEEYEKLIQERKNKVNH